MTSNVKSWATSVPVGGCGLLSCDECYPTEADVAEALAVPVAPAVQPAPVRPASAAPVSLAGHFSVARA